MTLRKKGATISPRKKPRRNRWPILGYEIQIYLGAWWLKKQTHQVSKKIDSSEYSKLIGSVYTEIMALHTRIRTEIFLDKHKSTGDLGISNLGASWTTTNAVLVKGLHTAYDTGVMLEDGVTHPPKVWLDKYLARAGKARGDHLNWGSVFGQMDLCLRSILHILPRKHLPQLDARLSLATR